MLLEFTAEGEGTGGRMQHDDRSKLAFGEARPGDGGLKGVWDWTWCGLSASWAMALSPMLRGAEFSRHQSLLESSASALVIIV